ncbi:T9SS type A sorting domain-containing protein [Hyunsoonleella flava]|uniref:T9SS type A sorting domain-containing protein n=1 Tax=Hyunsoonleella flava TaxID=2527939 RepID=A0A4V2JAL5_9FLAO|nr:ELWxxDGT repeat protein [Hyunsoonleella flava]TBN06716.1 T9SS type A sorting domain-containing protein [Hyunsoonleella flava]
MKKSYFFIFLSIVFLSQSSAQISQVKFISSNAKTSSITSTSFGVLFVADDDPSIINAEPFISDGTETGTYKLKEINSNNVLTNASGVYISDNTEYVELNGYVYFAGGTASNNFELWRTDGTTAGTTLVKEINSSSASSSFPLYLNVLNGSLIFSASNGLSGSNNGTELWISDGTSTGTVLLKDIYPGTDSSGPSDFCLHDNKLYFTANNGPNGRELWVTDGTTAGTQMVKDMVVGSGSSNPKYTTSYNGDLYFSANGELYKSNGVVGNGGALKNINTSGNSAPTGFKVYNNRLYFSANDGVNGRELWRTNGTVFGTQLFKDINPSGNSNPANLTIVNGLLYFRAGNGTSGKELWSTDGTSANTSMIEVPSIAEMNPTKLIDYNNKLYFFGDNTTGQRKLWSSDGTVSGTVQISGSPTIINERKMAVHNNELYLGASNLYKYIDPSLSSEEFENNSVSLYPNPVSNKFTIKSSQNIERVEVYNALGRLVKTFSNTANSSYNISSLNSGLYLVKVLSGNKIKTLKLIKN